MWSCEAGKYTTSCIPSVKTYTNVGTKLVPGYRALAPGGTDGASVCATWNAVQRFAQMEPYMGADRVTDIIL